MGIRSVIFRWLIWIPAPFVFGASLYYGRAVLRGLACARDDQRRMTLLNPWFFFMREFKPRGIRLAVGLIPWLACGACLRCYVHFWLHSIPTSQLWRTVIHSGPSFCLSHLGIIGLAIAAITLLAPRFKSAVSLASIGALAGFLPWICLILFDGSRIIFETERALAVPLLTAGIAAFCLGWLYVRFRLDRAWFRFDG